MRHDSRVPIIIAVVVVLAAGLSQVPRVLHSTAPKKGVNVKPETVNLAFGAQGVEPATSPVTLETAEPATSPSAPPAFEFLPPPRAAETPAPAARPPATPPSQCPTASSSAAAERVAGFNVEGSPVAGRYRWKEKGTLTIVGFPALPIDQLTSRLVANVATSGAVTSYDVTRTGLAETETDTIEVRGDGVYLARLKVVGNGQTIDFHPPSTLAPKILSLPVTSETVTSTGVDPINNLVVTIQGTVDRSTRVRIDACGELVDAWAFSGRRVLQSVTDTSQAIQDTTYDLLFAPQYGGLFVGDHIVTKGSFGPLQYTSDMTATIGGTHPVSAS